MSQNGKTTVRSVTERIIDVTLKPSYVCPLARTAFALDEFCADSSFLFAYICSVIITINIPVIITVFS